MGTAYRKPKTIDETANELAINKNHNKLYAKTRAFDYEGKISELVGEKMLMLDAIIKRGKVDLSNYDQVSACAIAYMEACRRSDTIPSFEGLAFSLGYSRQWLYSYISRNESEKTVEYIQHLRTLFVDMALTASSKRWADNATTIFAAKNATGLGFSDKGDSLPEERLTDDAGMSIDDYKRKYGHLLEE